MPANAAFLKDIPLFAPMDDAERAAVAEIMDEVTFSAGQQMFHERDQGGICYVIRTGRIELSVLDESGEKLVLDVLEPGELCGELSLLDGGNRSTTAVALTDVEALVLERPEFVSFLRKQPDASLDVLSALAKRIRRADKLLKQRVQDPNELIEGGATLGDRVADRVASFGGSWRFIGLFMGTMAAWILWNLLAPLPLRSGAVHGLQLDPVDAGGVAGADHHDEPEPAGREGSRAQRGRLSRQRARHGRDRRAAREVRSHAR